MLIVGDIHGNKRKAEAFLQYKPEEKHCFAGDYTDSFTASDSDILETMELIFSSDAEVLSGNHDNQYFRSAGNFTRCSGWRWSSADEFIKVIEKYKDRIKASTIADDFFICHGGVTPLFSRPFDTIEELNKFCNDDFDKFKYSPIVQPMPSPIFNIGVIRGGWHTYSGIFWASFGYEKFDKRFNIVCGHTHKDNPRTMEVGKGARKRLHVCVDCRKFICFNTVTRQLESFLPDGWEEYEIKF